MFFECSELALLSVVGGYVILFFNSTIDGFCTTVCDGKPLSLINGLYSFGDEPKKKIYYIIIAISMYWSWTLSHIYYIKYLFLKNSMNDFIFEKCEQFTLISVSNCGNTTPAIISYFRKCGRGHTFTIYFKTETQLYSN